MKKHPKIHGDRSSMHQFGELMCAVTTLVTLVAIIAITRAQKANSWLVGWLKARPSIPPCAYHTSVVPTNSRPTLGCAGNTLLSQHAFTHCFDNFITSQTWTFYTCPLFGLIYFDIICKFTLPSYNPFVLVTFTKKAYWLERTASDLRASCQLSAVSAESARRWHSKMA